MQGVPEKIAQSFTRDKFGTVCRKMKIFAPKWPSNSHLLWIPWIIQFGMLFSSWCIVRSSETSIVWNKSWTVAWRWSAENKSMVLLTYGLNDCQWSFIHTVDTLNIVSVNTIWSVFVQLLQTISVIRLIALKVMSALMLFELLNY